MAEVYVYVMETMADLTAEGQEEKHIRKFADRRR